MKREYPPETIDTALVATLRMLMRGKVVVWQGARMYTTRQGTILDGVVVGDDVDTVFIWFERYSTANPFKSNWGESPASIAFMKRRYIGG